MNERRPTTRRALLRRVWIIGLARPEAAAAMAVTAKSVDRRPREPHVRRTGETRCGRAARRLLPNEGRSITEPAVRLPRISGRYRTDTGLILHGCCADAAPRIRRRLRRFATIARKGRKRFSESRAPLPSLPPPRKLPPAPRASLPGGPAAAFRPFLSIRLTVCCFKARIQMDTSFLADLIQNIQYDSGDKRSLSQISQTH